MVLAQLLEAGLLHGDCMTVTGRTMAQNLEALDPPAPDGDVVHVLSDPIHPQGGIAVLTGSLAPKGAVVKVAGIDTLTFDGTARVFDGEDKAMTATAGALQDMMQKLTELFDEDAAAAWARAASERAALVV